MLGEKINRRKYSADKNLSEIAEYRSLYIGYKVYIVLSATSGYGINQTEYPSKRHTLSQCWLNVGTTFATMAQHRLTISCLLTSNCA